MCSHLRETHHADLSQVHHLAVSRQKLSWCRSSTTILSRACLSLLVLLPRLWEYPKPTAQSLVQESDSLSVMPESRPMKKSFIMFVIVFVLHSGYPPEQSISVVSFSENASERSLEMPTDLMTRHPCSPNDPRLSHPHTSPGTQLGSENVHVSYETHMRGFCILSFGFSQYWIVGWNRLLQSELIHSVFAYLVFLSNLLQVRPETSMWK